MNKLSPENQKRSQDFRERVAKLRRQLAKDFVPAPVAKLSFALNFMPPVYEAALSGSLPKTLAAGARLIRAMAQTGFAYAKDKAEAQAALNQ